MADPTPVDSPTPTAPTVVRTDAWVNLLTGIGDAQRDKRMHSRPTATLLSYRDAATLYRGNDIAKRIVNRPAHEMTREWGEVQVEDAPDVAEAVDAKLEELDARRKIRDALRFRRAYGGSLVLIGANDGVGMNGLREPLDLDRLVSVDYLNVFDADEAPVVEWYRNPLAPNYGEPMIYRISPRALGTSEILGVLDVHESRVLRFTEPVASRDDLITARGWGDSVIATAIDVIRDFDAAWSGAGALLQDFAQAVYTIEGLSDAIAANRSELVIERLRIMDLSRSLLRAVLLDAKESFERKPTPIAGLPDLLDRFCNRLAAAIDMPVTLLMGQAPAGLNATGASDIRSWYDHLASLQATDVTPQVERLVRAILRAKAGPTKGTEPDVWSWRWRPLWQLDDAQRAETRSKNAQADAAYIDRGVVTPEEVAKSRFGGDTYGHDLQLDTEAREAFAKVDPAEIDPEEAATLREPANPAPKAPVSPAAAPGGGPLPSAGGAASVQDTALNGAQLGSATELVTKVAHGEIPPDSAKALLRIGLRISEADAKSVIDPAIGFKPREPDPEPAAAVPPGAPAPKPPAVDPEARK